MNEERRTFDVGGCAVRLMHLEKVGPGPASGGPTGSVAAVRLARDGDLSER